VVRALGAFTPILVPDVDPAFRELAARYELRVFPTIVFAQPDGTQVETVTGVVSADDLRAAAERALR
jgi:thiol:disulfide interchange protein